MVLQKPFVWRGLVTLSWNRFNLFNLHRFSKSTPERELNKTAYQLRWRAKQLTVPYHAGHITQRMFKRLRVGTVSRGWMDPKILPRGIPRPPSDKTMGLPVPPTSMLAFAFMERRLDTTVFRACFARSIWEARRLCTMGAVRVNGKPVRQLGYILEDGDIVQVNADYMPLLNTELRGNVREELEAETEQLLAETESAKDSADGAGGADGAVDANDTDNTDVDDDTERRRLRAEPSALATRDWGFHPVPYMTPWVFVPEYLEVNYNTMSVCFLRSPTIKPGRCEVPSPYDELTHQRAFDLYTSK